MKAKIGEYIENRTKFIRITFEGAGESQKDQFSEKFKLDDFETKLAEFFKSEKSSCDSTKELDVYIRFGNYSLINKFEKISKLLIMGAAELKLPSLVKLKNLREIHINQLSKPTRLENINTLMNLEELAIGDFSLVKPIELINLDELVKMKGLKKLILGNVKFLDKDVKKIERMNGLEELRLPQNLEVEELAYLSAKMPRTKSKELQPYQMCITQRGDIKINGKRKPYLDRVRDKVRVEKYVKEFERIKQKYQ